MEQVEIFATYDGHPRRFLGTANRMVMIEHSWTIHDQLEIDSLAHAELHGAPGGALWRVIQGVQQHRCRIGCRYRSYRVDTAGLSVAHGVAILLALEALNIEPVQKHVLPHIMSCISNNKLEVDDIITVHNAHGRFHDSDKVWRHMIQRIGWTLANRLNGDWYNGALQAKLQAKPNLANPNALLDAIASKTAEIEQRYQAQQARETARARQSRWLDMQHRRRRREEYAYRQSNEYRERQPEEARVGLRVLDDRLYSRLFVHTAD